MRRAAQKGAEMATIGGLLAGDYKKDDGDGRAPAFDALFPLVNVKNRTAAMGGILVVLLVLFVVPFTGSGEGAANSEWRPQSQLQRSQRQADLYDDLTLEARTRGRGARDRLPPGARGQPAKAAGSARSALPAESAENQAAYEDGDDEEAFIRMAQQQETEMMANELGTQRKGQRGPELRGQGSTRDRSTRVGAAEDYDEDDEDEQDQDAALPQPGLGARKAPAWHAAPEMVPRPASMVEEEDADGNQEGMPGDDEDDTDIPERDEEGALFADHVDDEPAPDAETTDEMADSMFDEMDAAPRDGVVSFSEWWKVISRDEPDAKMAMEREHFQSVDKDGSGEVSRGELRQDWRRDDMHFLDSSDPRLQDDDGEVDADEDNLGGDEDAVGDEDEVGDEGELGDEGDDSAEDGFGLSPDEEADDEADDEDGGEGDGSRHAGSGDADEQGADADAQGPHRSSLFSFLFGSDDLGDEQSGNTLGDTLKRAAVRLFKQRAPRPHALNVKVLTSESRVSWSQAEHQCKKQRQRVCPDMVLDKMRLCLDRDAHHRGRWLPTDEFLTWIELDTCSRATLPRDQHVLPLIACC